MKFIHDFFSLNYSLLKFARKSHKKNSFSKSHVMSNRRALGSFSQLSEPWSPLGMESWVLKMGCLNCPTRRITLFFHVVSVPL